MERDRSNDEGLPWGLGPTPPCPSTVHMESYSASVVCVVNRFIATTTKICTRSHDCTQACATRRFGSCPTPSYAAVASRLYHLVVYFPAGGPSVICFSIVHFRGWSIRQVSCYTLLGRFQLPWPRPCCLDEPTPFAGV